MIWCYKYTTLLRVCQGVFITFLSSKILGFVFLHVPFPCIAFKHFVHLLLASLIKFFTCLALVISSTLKLHTITYHRKDHLSRARAKINTIKCLDFLPRGGPTAGGADPARYVKKKIIILLHYLLIIWFVFDYPLFEKILFIIWAENNLLLKWCSEVLKQDRTCPVRSSLPALFLRAGGELVLNAQGAVRRLAVRRSPAALF